MRAPTTRSCQTPASKVLPCSSSARNSTLPSLPVIGERIRPAGREAGGCRVDAEALEHFAVDCRIAHDPAPRHDSAPGLELGLDERNTSGRIGQEAAYGWEHEPERDEGEVQGCELDRLGQRSELPEIRALHADHARVTSQPVEQLATPNVDRIHDPRAALEEDIGEAARAGSGVEAGEAGWIDRECLQRRLELLPARDAQRGGCTSSTPASAATAWPAFRVRVAAPSRMTDPDRMMACAWALERASPRSTRSWSSRTRAIGPIRPFRRSLDGWACRRSGGASRRPPCVRWGAGGAPASPAWRDGLGSAPRSPPHRSAADGEVLHGAVVDESLGQGDLEQRDAHVRLVERIQHPVAKAAHRGALLGRDHEAPPG